MDHLTLINFTYARCRRINWIIVEIIITLAKCIEGFRCATILHDASDDVEFNICRTLERTEYMLIQENLGILERLCSGALLLYVSNWKCPCEGGRPPPKSERGKW